MARRAPLSRPTLTSLTIFPNPIPDMKTAFAAAFLLTVVHAAPAAVLFSDNFNAPDSNSFDASAIAGRLSGLVAGETYLRSWGTQEQISTNQLLTPTTNSGGLRFENALNDPGTTGAADRYNWAGGAGGSSILASGGFTVSFDWYAPESTLGDWISFQVGTNNADSGNLANGGTDYGILFRNNGNTERFDNGTNLGAGGTFTAGAGTLQQVLITYKFSSFADGTSVNAVSTVNGVQVANDTFTWDGNAGELRMELGAISANSRIDNLTISSIPEPSAALLLGLPVLGLLRRRRSA